MSINRRTFLVGVGGALAVGVGAERSAAYARRRPVLGWAARVAPPASTRNLGVEYLTRHPEEANRPALIGHLAGLVPFAALLSSQGAPERFNERLRQDFLEGDILRMGGWLLSRTELRLCALAVIEDDARTGSTGVFAEETVEGSPAFHWTAPTARFTVPGSLPAVVFNVKSGAPNPQRLVVRLDGIVVDEREVSGGDWQRVRYVMRASSDSPVALELTTTPEWKPQNDFRTIGVGIDQIWAA